MYKKIAHYVTYLIEKLAPAEVLTETVNGNTTKKTLKFDNSSILLFIQSTELIHMTYVLEDEIYHKIFESIDEFKSCVNKIPKVSIIEAFNLTLKNPTMLLEKCQNLVKAYRRLERSTNRFQNNLLKIQEEYYKYKEECKVDFTIRIESDINIIELINYKAILETKINTCCDNYLIKLKVDPKNINVYYQISHSSMVCKAYYEQMHHIKTTYNILSWDLPREDVEYLRAYKLMPLHIEEMISKDQIYINHIKEIE